MCNKLVTTMLSCFIELDRQLQFSVPVSPFSDGSESSDDDKRT